MTQFLEKKSFEKRKAEILALPTEKFIEYIAKEIETAYWAGYCKFNGLDNTLDSVSFSMGKSKEIPLVGPDSLLASLYLQSKGFKP
jgi:hypothetical protein